MDEQTVETTLEIPVTVTIQYSEVEEYEGDHNVIGGTRTRTVYQDPELVSVELAQELDAETLMDLAQKQLDLLGMLS